MKKILLFSIIVLTATFANAQEEAVLGHYLFNPVLINPAATGFDQDHHDIFMNIRSGFSGFPGAPKTYALSYNGPVGKRLGLGGMVYTEDIASITYYRTQFSAAFRYDINDLQLATGFAAQFNRMRLDNDDVFTNGNVYDPDEIINLFEDGDKVFDASLGAYGSYKDNLTFGLAFPSLIRTRLDEIEGKSNNSGLQFFTLYAGGNFMTGPSKIKLQPSVLLKRLRNVPTQVDLNLLAAFLQDRLITGASFTASEQDSNVLGLLLGTQYNALRFIYSYNVHMGNFQTHHGGSHEITVNIRFKKADEQTKRSKKYRQ